jgi:hypothetical protein
MSNKQNNKDNNFLEEIIMTFSNTKSKLSSKKIERFIVFNVFLVITVYYIFKNVDDLDARSFIEIIGVWLFYGGYNSFMNLRDKKLESQDQSQSDQNLGS